MRRLPFFIALLATSAIAHAGDKPVYAPAPAWVKPAPPIDATKLGEDSPVVVLFDNQQRLENGQVWSYFDSATRAASAQALSAIGTVQLPWQPAQGDLIVHKAEIIRGAEHIDLVHGGNPFTVLRREEGIDQRMLDGRLTATMAVEGLRVGDVLHIAFSMTRRDPTLKGDLQTFAPVFADPARMQFARVRLSWPVGSDVRWKAYASGIDAQPVVEGGYKVLTIPLPIAKQPDLPNDAPARFAKLPIVEATSFADWAAVSKVMAPLYATDGLIAPGSPLAGEVARIKAASANPLVRTGLALQLVQEKIRYLLMGMDTGNYVPQPPAKTWEWRYGDCKAKTLLLLALLHDLGIEAEPVVANSKLGDMVPNRLPGVAAFDHVLVRATVAGETLWLDGTDGGARLVDLHDTPPLGYVLPLRAAGAEPVKIVLRAKARPDLTIDIAYDQRAGINLPAPFTGSVAVRGSLAESIRLAKAQGSKDDLDKMVASLFKNFAADPTIATSAFAFDDAQGVATVTATGVAYPSWERDGQRWRMPLDRTVAGLEFNPDRARAAWRDIPVRTDPPSYTLVRTHIRLPAGGAAFTIDGVKAAQGTLAGTAVDRSVVQVGDMVTVSDKIVSTGAEIAVADIPAAKRALATAKANLPRAIAPADYPHSWEEIAAARRNRSLDPIAAVFTRRIADKPDEQSRYTDRAWFYERMYDRAAAIADLDKAIAIEPDADTYLKRSNLYSALGKDDKALADAVAANKLDPSSDDALGRLAFLRAERGEKDGALDLIQDRIDTGGKDKANFLSSKAELQMRLGDKDGAIETIDSAVNEKPRDANVLNSRCWIKGLLNVALDTALKDCTKAIELAEDTSPVLDSRAMVYFRLGRFDDALGDLDSALALAPDRPASLYMRGIVLKRQGKAREGDIDVAAARIMEPQVDRQYRPYGITP